MGGGCDHLFSPAQVSPHHIDLLTAPNCIQCVLCLNFTDVAGSKKSNVTTKEVVHCYRPSR